MGGRADVDPVPAGLEHLPHGGGDRLPVQPVERLRKRRHSKRPEAARERLGGHLHPARVPDSPSGSLSPGLDDHSRVGIDSDHLCEEGRQRKRDRAGPAADVQEPTGAVEPELVTERAGRLRWIREAPASVERRAPQIERRIPRDRVRRHEEKVAQPSNSGYSGDRRRPMEDRMLWVVLLLVLANLVVAIPFADAALRGRRRRPGG
jgi:hypothetical protein